MGSDRMIRRMFFQNQDLGRPRSSAAGPEYWCRLINIELLPQGEARVGALLAHLQRLEETFEAGSAPSESEEENDDHRRWGERILHLWTMYANIMAQRIFDFEYDIVGAAMTDQMT